MSFWTNCSIWISATSPEISSSMSSSSSSPPQAAASNFTSFLTYGASTWADLSNMFAISLFVENEISKNFSSALLSSKPFYLANIYAVFSASLALKFTIGHYFNCDPEFNWIGTNGTNALLFFINFSVSSITALKSMLGFSYISCSINSAISVRLCDLAVRYASASYPVSTKTLTRSSMLAVKIDELNLSIGSLSCNES